MTRMLLVMGLALGCLAADDAPRQTFQTTTTERVDFAAGGVLRLKNSTGMLMVEGWDRPEVEITTIKVTKARYATRAEGERVLAEMHSAIEHSGGEIVITTDFPRKSGIKPFRRGRIGVDLT